MAAVPLCLALWNWRPLLHTFLAWWIGLMI